VPTPVGDAGCYLQLPTTRLRALLILGHGAGGGVDAPDLLAARRTALDGECAIARVLQPYRMAGRRAPAPAAQLDAAWLTVVEAIRAKRSLSAVPLVIGGRSSGARVACRTAMGLQAHAVLALAFPLHPPGRPERSRADELAAAGVPVVVVQGERDAFGSAADVDAMRCAHVDVRPVADADHSLRTAMAKQVVAAAVVDLLAAVSS
jgi:predicted alpha/beta-hydrolase family hydrolase